MKRRIDVIALLILIGSAINCGLIGLLEFDALAWVFGGQTLIISRIIYVIVAVAGLWCINLIVTQSRSVPQPMLTANRRVFNEEVERHV